MPRCWIHDDRKTAKWRVLEGAHSILALCERSNISNHIQLCFFRIAVKVWHSKVLAVLHAVNNAKWKLEANLGLLCGGGGGLWPHRSVLIRIPSLNAKFDRKLRHFQVVGLVTKCGHILTAEHVPRMPCSDFLYNTSLLAHSMRFEMATRHIICKIAFTGWIWIEEINIHC